MVQNRNMESKRLFAQCEICKSSFNVQTLLQSSNDDFYCKDCFKRCFYSGGKTEGAGDTKTEILDVTGKKFMPHPEKYVRSPRIATLLHGHQNLSVMSLSKRPLQCPKADCNKYISVCTLESHFKHEHKETPIVTTHLDARCASEFYPRDVRYSCIQCIVLLKVINLEISNICRGSRAVLYGSSIDDPKPVMVLMATRIPDIHYSSDDERESPRSPECFSARTEEEIFRKGDRIIVWLGSNVQTNLTYTVAVSTLNKEIRQKYFGPMLTLNETPEKLCKDGNCLILSYFHCTCMTENGTKPLALDVLVHNPE